MRKPARACRRPRALAWSSQRNRRRAGPLKDCFLTVTLVGYGALVPGAPTGSSSMLRNCRGIKQPQSPASDSRYDFYKEVATILNTLTDSTVYVAVAWSFRRVRDR